ncbi:MAG: N-acetylmuramoyl-L-alanine amidase [Deltaproteobacteria bacterium]|nr:N-acetylmuramoyl-L-alanine amidase [Deltaproteobacteria bacterium]
MFHSPPNCPVSKPTLLLAALIGVLFLSCGPKSDDAARSPAPSSGQPPAATQPTGTAPPTYLPTPPDLIERFGTLPPTPEQFDVVVIDPGHGGHDWGAIGIGEILEKDVVLAVSRFAASCLRQEKPGLRVFLTREEDFFIPLADRTKIANNLNADVFVSIHANAAKNPKAQGIETYLMNPEATDREAHRVALAENASLGLEGADPNDPLLMTLWSLKSAQHIRGSEDFGAVVHQTLAREFNFRSRGVLQAPFFVLVRANMPALLIELGFLTNETDATSFRNEAYLKRLGRGICRGILDYGSEWPRKLDLGPRKRMTGDRKEPKGGTASPGKERKPV